jgi:hypothetical protein
MFLPTHLATGLIIGKLTGNYSISLIGSVIMDLDHLLAYYRVGILFNLKKLFAAITSKASIGISQRNYLHNIFICLLAITISLAINFSAGLIFSIAYILHLILDSLDDSRYYPFYPNIKINLHGPIKYFSWEEFVITFILILIFFII